MSVATCVVRAQQTTFDQQPPPKPSKKSKAADSSTAPKPGERPSIPPAFSIAAEPLGFSAPGPIYLGQRSSMASLDFLDENHILFTFRVPGLLKRDSSYDEGQDSGERQVRALVLSLPTGSIEADELWTLHDRERYLWVLGDGHFLLRDGNEIKQGDATLKTKPVLRFPGPLVSMTVDPLGKFLVTNSREPSVPPVQKATAAASAPSTPLKSQLGPGINSSDKFGSGSATPGGTASQANGASDKLEFNSGSDRNDESESSEVKGSTAPPASQAPKPAPAPKPDDEPATPQTTEMVVRILDRAEGKVLLVSRIHNAVHLPINSQGYLEALRDRGQDWELNLYFFNGGVRHIGYVQSVCLPTLEFVAEDRFMATVCSDGFNSKLIALNLDGRHLWEVSAPSGTIWPHLVRSANGLRVARESLAVNHPITSSAPIDPEDIKAQRVTVFDAVTGHVSLTASASPILDAGGNVALSPSGRRIAVLHAGSIDVWELDAPPATSSTAK